VDLVTALAAVGLTAALFVRVRAPRVLGTVLDRGRTRPFGRLAALALLVGAGVALATVEDAPPRGWVALGLSAAFMVLRPAFDERVCGSEGVRRGWWLVRFEDLEQWRLIGEHLRFQLFGEWDAVPLAPAHQAAVRERLVAAAPGRESAFGHGAKRPDDPGAPDEPASSGA
jgi:hypothetical protein